MGPPITLSADDTPPLRDVHHEPPSRPLWVAGWRSTAAQLTEIPGGRDALSVLRRLREDSTPGYPLQAPPEE